MFIAKRNIVDYIWKSANLESIAVTYPEAQTIYDGRIKSTPVNIGGAFWKLCFLIESQIKE